MARKQKELWTCDCETDPFKFGRVPEPFIWGAYNGVTGEFKTFRETIDFIFWASEINGFFYAHNGGKFDFMFLLQFIGEETNPQIINGRIVEIKIGEATFRDSYAIMPTPLSDYAKDEVDYALFEADVREQYMDDLIIPYLKADCVYLWEMVSEYREIAGKRTTIASNALSFCKTKLDIDPGKTNKVYDDQFRAYYFGGRVEAFKPGIHKHASIFDIKSAYPRAMMDKHPTDYFFFSDKNPEGAHFISLRCFSKGAFPRRGRAGLEFPFDRDTYHVTHWEYNAAINLGLLEDVEILDCVHFENEISFEDYVNYWYGEKQKAEDRGEKAKRYIAKIMLNSLYGKLAQNPFNYSSFKILPLGSDIEEGWYLSEQYGDYEIHGRDAAQELEERYGDELDTAPIFLNVATAASITGYVRAMLLEAVYSVGRDRVAYCDTDSLIVLGKKKININLGKELGDWDYEGRADEIAIGGKKLYASSPLLDGKDKGSRKIASKGAKLSANEIVRLVKGETITWQNDAPTFSLAKPPSFVVRKLRATA